MKSAIAIFMIFILMFSCINRLWILVDFSINQDFIAEVLCINKDKPVLACNGKCYLSKKLKEQEEKEKEQVPSSLKEKSEIVYINSFSSVVLPGLSTSIISKLNSAYSFHSISNHLDRIFRPPKVV